MTKLRRASVEQCLTLNADELVREHFLRTYERSSGVLRWIDGAGVPVGAVRYEAELSPKEGRGCIEISCCVDGCPVSQRVELNSTRPRLGGSRWWFICPVKGQRVGRLYLPLFAPSKLGCAPAWAGRKAHQLGYASQRESRWARAARRAVKGVARLEGKPPTGSELRWRSVFVAPRLVSPTGGRRARTVGCGGIAFVMGAGVVDIPAKPYRMHEATYSARVGRILGMR